MGQGRLGPAACGLARGRQEGWCHCALGALPLKGADTKMHRERSPLTAFLPEGKPDPHPIPLPQPSPPPAPCLSIRAVPARGIPPGSVPIKRLRREVEGSIEGLQGWPHAGCTFVEPGKARGKFGTDAPQTHMQGVGMHPGSGTSAVPPHPPVH